MCTDIDYAAQSHCISRFDQLFGNGGKRHLDLACGTGQHIRHLIDKGYQSQGLDLNQPMLELAQQRCPEASFSLQNICDFTVDTQLDLITCFLYSIHYSGNLENLKQCLQQVYLALHEGGLFCFNVVEKNLIRNDSFVRHSVHHEGSEFTFQSGWYYSGKGDTQALKLSVDRKTQDATHVWHDEHPMVAISFAELTALLEPQFDVHLFEHNYDTLQPWNGESGNALFVCVKRPLA
ncbi:class I SAM-dependent methyltransferase [Vibrio stylophorae]